MLMALACGALGLGSVLTWKACDTSSKVNEATESASAALSTVHSEVPRMNDTMNNRSAELVREVNLFSTRTTATLDRTSDVICNGVANMSRETRRFNDNFDGRSRELVNEVRVFNQNCATTRESIEREVKELNRTARDALVSFSTVCDWAAVFLASATFYLVLPPAWRLLCYCCATMFKIAVAIYTVLRAM